MRARIYVATLGLDQMTQTGETVWRRAAARTINRAMVTLRTGMVKRVAGEQGIRPARLVRLRTRIDKASAKHPSARIRVLTFGIAAIKLSGVRDTRKKTSRKTAAPKTQTTRRKARRRPVGRGVTASGGHSWPLGFIANGQNSGKPFVFQRRGKKRLPIDNVRIPIENQVELAIERGLPGARDQVLEQLPRELAYRMSVAKGAV